MVQFKFVSKDTETRDKKYEVAKNALAKWGMSLNCTSVLCITDDTSFVINYGNDDGKDSVIKLVIDADFTDVLDFGQALLTGKCVEFKCPLYGTKNCDEWCNMSEMCKKLNAQAANHKQED